MGAHAVPRNMIVISFLIGTVDDLFLNSDTTTQVILNTPSRVTSTWDDHSLRIARSLGDTRLSLIGGFKYRRFVRRESAIGFEYYKSFPNRDSPERTGVNSYRSYTNSYAMGPTAGLNFSHSITKGQALQISISGLFLQGGLKFMEEKNSDGLK